MVVHDQSELGIGLFWVRPKAAHARHVRDLEILSFSLCAPVSSTGLTVPEHLRTMADTEYKPCSQLQQEEAEPPSQNMLP